MQVSVLIFYTDFHAFSAIAIETDSGISYRRLYRSIPEIIEGMELMGLVGEGEAISLSGQIRFDRSVPLFKGMITAEALAEAGFVWTSSKLSPS